MSLLKIDWQADEKTLREFSEWWMFFLGMVFAPLAYLRAPPGAENHVWHGVAYAVWALAVAGRLLGAWRPSWLRPIYLVMMALALPIGWLISHLALGLLYYGVITPLGLAFRLSGRDVLKRRFDPDATTYWEPRQQETPRERYFRQF